MSLPRQVTSAQGRDGKHVSFGLHGVCVCKLLSQLCVCVCVCIYVCVHLCSLRDLSSLTRDQTHALSRESRKS